MEIIKQSFLAAKVKEELRELKRGQQHRANLQTQASVHDSSEVIEATPMSSPISFGEDVETSPPPEVQGAGEEMQLVPHPVQLQEAIKTHPQL